MQDACNSNASFDLTTEQLLSAISEMERAQEVVKVGQRPVVGHTTRVVWPAAHRPQRCLGVRAPHLIKPCGLHLGACCDAVTVPVL